MAFNYWFWPPDNLDPATAFAKPYSDQFWPDAWAERERLQEKRAKRNAPPVEGGGEVDRQPAAGVSRSGGGECLPSRKKKRRRVTVTET